MGSKIDISNQRFGKLVTLCVEYTARGREWLCQCDCGNQTRASAAKLRFGQCKSCGCITREATAQRSTKHGYSRRGQRSPEYRAWIEMKTRCYNPKATGFQYWGGRGITICDEWRFNFMSFFTYVGVKPTPKHSIDRIDVNGNYEPGNVRWATSMEQNNNQRRLFMDESVVAVPEPTA